KKDVADGFREIARVGSTKSFLWLDTSYSTQADEDNHPEAIGVELLAGKYAPIHDSSFKDQLADPNLLSSHSRKWTTKYRDALEQAVFDDLADELSEAKKSETHFRFAVRDGTLTAARGKFVTTAIGLSKSFNTRFLEPKYQTKVLGLLFMHRTPVFKFS